MHELGRLAAIALVTGVLSAAALYALRAPGLANEHPARFSHHVVDAQGPSDPWGKAVGDIDGDGLLDLVVGGHASQELVWYRNPDWTKATIATDENFGTDHEVIDIDSDGRNDVVSVTQARLVWYRNPDWVPNTIAETALHDIAAADFDGDGRLDLVARNQSAFSGSGHVLYFYRQTAPDRWEASSVAVPEGEGLAVQDIDRDGSPDVIVNGQWLRNPGGALDARRWHAYTYVDRWDWPHTYIDAGDINGDGRPDIVLAPAEPAGKHYRLSWFEAPEDLRARWQEHVVERQLESVQHFVAIGDVNNDGAADILSASMHQGSDPDEIKVYYNIGGAGSDWRKSVIASHGSHSMQLADLDRDGDLDLFGANWSGEYQPVELWQNDTCDSLWRRHVVDAEMPWRAIFVDAVELDGDGRVDIVAGGHWYRNPGKGAQRWRRASIGRTARNMAAAHDFDGDGHIDILATQGIDAEANAEFVWARNDGKGNFKILPVGTAAGDFLQGAAVGALGRGGDQAVALSWHQADQGIQLFHVPSSPAASRWKWERISNVSQDEALSAGDINGDGDLDLLTGTHWLRNDGGTWSDHALFHADDNPDRNRLADMNNDGRLDAVVGYEAISVDGKLAWYEQGISPEKAWRERIIAYVTGPMSLDVADMDGDSDLDVVVGEHNLEKPESARLLVFENIDGQGQNWGMHVVYTGDEHHDGANAVDIDGDGDMDIVSIGWGHRQLLLYENLAADCEQSTEGTRQ